MLKVHYLAGYRNGVLNLRDSDFVRSNFGTITTSTRITSATPDGVLAGMLAMFTDESEVGVSDGVVIPVGVFALDSSANAFENQPAIASNKLTVIMGGSFIETDIYADNGPAYTVGIPVYAAAAGASEGLITSTVAGAIIGYVYKTPTADDPFLGIKLSI